MTARIAIALAQINPTVGDIDGNVGLIRDARRRAAEEGADVVLLPELCVVGYPPEDLVLKPALTDHAMRAVEILAAETADGGPALIVGSPWREKDGRLYNAALLLQGGRVAGRVTKHQLPNYGVFDEKRWFVPGPVPGPLAFPLPGGEFVRLGLMVCEDMWTEDVAEGLAESGAEILLVPNGSPWEEGKQDRRLQLAVARSTETGLPLVYVNQVGGQDELVFDGASFALDAHRRLVAQLPSFVEHVAVTRWERGSDEVWRPVGDGPILAPLDQCEGVYRAMVLGLRDYVGKNRFPGVVLGMSGGIDSALSAAVAADALGPERVHAIMMPSRFTSRESLDDATDCSRRLGIRLDEIAIGPAVEAFRGMLAPIFGDRPPDITEENIQARIRGVLLMAVSNKLGPMVLTTGNKSEMSVGYATLYGDMCGGYSVLKDVYKTMVFALCRWRNSHRPEGFLRARRRGDPRAHHHQAAHGRAARQPEGPGLAPALRPPRQRAGGPGRARPEPPRAGPAGLRPGRGPQGLEPPRPRRVQAPPGPARRQDHREGLRPRPPLPDHERLPAHRPRRAAGDREAAAGRGLGRRCRSSL